VVWRRENREERVAPTGIRISCGIQPNPALTPTGLISVLPRLQRTAGDSGVECVGRRTKMEPLIFGQVVVRAGVGPREKGSCSGKSAPS